MSKKPSEWTCAVCEEKIFFGPDNGKFYSYKIGQEHYLTLRLFGIPIKKYYADTCDYVHERCNDDYKAQRIKKEGTLLVVFKDMMILCAFLFGLIVLVQAILKLVML